MCEEQEEVGTRGLDKALELGSQNWERSISVQIMKVETIVIAASNFHSLLVLEIAANWVIDSIYMKYQYNNF